MNITKFLNRVFLFTDLSEEHCKIIENFSSVQNLSKGEILFSEGQFASAFFIVISGKLKIYKISSEGLEQIVHIMQTGEIIAEAAIFSIQLYPAFCQAISESVILRVPKENFIKFAKENPDIFLKLMSGYSKKLRVMIAKIEELSLHDIKKRLANYLIKNSTTRDGENLCVLDTPKKEIAAVLGTVPETLSRTLNFFKKEKIIEVDGNNIQILDPEKLNLYT